MGHMTIRHDAGEDTVSYRQGDKVGAVVLQIVQPKVVVI